MPLTVERVLVTSIMTVLVSIFAWVYYRDRQEHERYWLFGWLAIEAHFAGATFEAFHLISGRFADWVAYSTLLVSGSAFFLAVASGLRSKRALFVVLLSAPATLYLTLDVYTTAPWWIFRSLLAGMLIAGIALIPFSRSRSRLSGWIWLAVYVPAGVAVELFSFNPDRGLDFILFSAFSFTGIVYWLRYRRMTPGVLVPALSFIAWGMVWPCAEIAAQLGVVIAGESVIWDLPKYWVAFGMIMTLFENEGQRLKGEIAERRQAEQALQQSEHWLRESQRASNIGSYAMELRTGVWRGSETMYEILGIPEDYPPTVEAWESLLHPDWREGVAQWLADAESRPGEQFERESVIVRMVDRQERWVLWRGAVVSDGRRGATLAGTVQDITAHKNIEEQLRQSGKMESIGRLAGGVAHDFNNLLTAINGYADLALARAENDERLRDYLSEVRLAGARAAELTYQLLAFSRRQMLQPRVLSLNGVVVETERLLTRLIGENIEIQTKLADDLGPVKADPGQINQVIVNLAVNGRDAMPFGGRLTIATGNATGAQCEQKPGEIADGAFVYLSVSDTGKGMDPETRKHLFEPFFTTKPRGQGTGLGLSTVYGIVNQSGGWIAVHSEAGSGSEFRIYLPRVNEPVEAPPAAEPVAFSPVAVSTILIVEDQLAARKLIATILRDHNFQTLEAASGEDAIEVLRAHKGWIDLVVTDVVMPGMSGQQLVDLIRVNRPELPALFISGYTDDVLIRHGATDETAFLQKPFTPEALVNKVHGLLHQPV